jgi:hypothetical protein
MLEDTEEQLGQVDDATADATPAGTTELAGEGAETTNAAPEGGTEDLTKAPPAVNLDEEVQFEVAGKSYTMKQAQIVEALEKAHAIAEREKSLTEKEKSMNRDYSQKSQANAQFRKSVETTFGRFPEQSELQALGKLWKSYFSNPQAKQLIDQVLTGQLTAANGSGQNARDPYVQALEQQIAELKEQVGGVTSSIEERETSARNAENQRIWSTWSKSKDSQGIKITEEVDRKMAPFVSALRQAMPDATPEQILDEAYKHATIDQLKENVAKQTLVSADKAKKLGVIKITPKGGQANDASKTYKQMLMESA